MDTLLVGSEVPRVDGLAKVAGKAVYGDDIIMNNMLYGVCRYVDIPAGRIDALDLSEAEKVPGVVRIATWYDIPGQRKLGAERNRHQQEQQAEKLRQYGDRGVDHFNQPHVNKRDQANTQRGAGQA